MIELSCPHCGVNHSLDESTAGQRVTCHSCGKRFKVPGVAKKGSASPTNPINTEAPKDSPTHGGDGSPSPTSTSTASGSPADTKENSPRKSSPGAQSGKKPSWRTPKPKNKKSGPTATPTSENTPEEPEWLDDDTSGSSGKMASGVNSGDVGSQVVASDLAEDEWNLPPDTNEYRAPDETEKEGKSAEDNEVDPLVSPPLAIDEGGIGFEGSASLLDLPAGMTSPTVPDEDPLTGGPAWGDDTLHLDVDDEGPSQAANSEDIRVKCHVCDSVTWVKASKAGKNIVCQDCGIELKVPQASPPSLKPSESRATSKKKPQGMAGWQLAKEAERPKRELPPGVSMDPAVTPPELHTSKIRRWGEEEPRKKEPVASDEPASSTRGSGSVSEEPVGGYQRAEWNEKEDFGLVDWLQDLLVVLRIPSMYGAAIMASFVMGAFGTLIHLAMTLSGEENGPVARIGGMCSATVSMPTLFAAATILAAVAMTMIQDAAANEENPGNWPDLNIGEILSLCAPMYVAIFVSAAPGILASQFVLCTGFGGWGFLFLPLMSVFALMPLLIISAFREQAMFSIYSRPIYDSVGKHIVEWRNFYIVCAGGFVVSLICMLLIGFLPFIIGAIFWLPMGMLWVLYGRAIGILARRLAWVIQSEKPAAADPDVV